MRTFSRADWEEAQRAWADGKFSREWRTIRHKAAMGGIIYPPSGDRHDSWEDAHPSQRAILIRAIRETPRLLESCLPGSHSWSDVITRLTGARDEWRAELDAKERHAAREREAENDTPRQAVMSIADIIRRIGDSA